MPTKKAFTTDEYIARITEIHGDKYDFSKVEYKRLKGKVTVHCKEHGEFQTQAMTLLTKTGSCPICKNAFRYMQRNKFIVKGREKFGDKFDYVDVPDIVSYNTKVVLDCKEHGFFTTVAGTFITTVNHACPKCANLARSAANVAYRKQQREIREKTFPKITNPKYLPKPKPVEYPDSKGMSAMIRGLLPYNKV